MTQYIDKDAVVAEIEKRQRMLNLDDPLGRGGMVELQLLKNKLNTLEVKEVDLEEEVTNWWNAHYSSKAYTFEGYTGHYLENSTVIEIAKHFFELGLKYRKESNNDNRRIRKF